MNTLLTWTAVGFLAWTGIVLLVGRIIDHFACPYCGEVHFADDSEEMHR